jgi:hypothetical protein
MSRLLEKPISEGFSAFRASVHNYALKLPYNAPTRYPKKNTFATYTFCGEYIRQRDMLERIYAPNGHIKPMIYHKSVQKRTVFHRVHNIATRVAMLEG